MATKKLSEPMKKALLSADADGWIPSGVIKVETFCALIDRRLTGILVRRDDTMTLGHYLTDAGKAKVAELRAAQCANPVCDVHDNDAPEIRAGDLIEIRKPGKHKWAMRVSRVNGGDLLEGKQVRMVDGRETRTRVIAVKPGEYTIIERAKPATTTVAAEQPRKTVTAKVSANRGIQASLAAAKLTEAQIDGLHIIGAPEKVRNSTYWGGQLHGRTLKALRARLLVEVDSLDLTEDGRDAYLRCQPTGRLPQEFADAWAGTTVLASDPIQATLVGPACLADESDNGGWEAITTNGQLIYWRRKLSDQTWLAVRQIEAGWRWQHLGPRSGHVNAEGTNRTVNAARQAADASATQREPVDQLPAVRAQQAHRRERTAAERRERNAVVVECTVEANPTTDTIVIERDEWNAMTPEQRLRRIEQAALETVNGAGGWGWGIENETDAAEVASEWKPQAINELIKMVQEHGAISPTRSAARAIRLDAIRKALWDLVTE